MSTGRTRWSRPVAVAGVGHSQIVRRSDASLASLALEAICGALADAGVQPHEVGAIATQPDHPPVVAPFLDGADTVSVNLVERLLGIDGDVAWHIELPGLVANAFVAGAHAVASGACDVCVVFRAMRNRAGRFADPPAGAAPGEFQFLTPVGMGLGHQALGGAYRRYLHDYGVSPDALADFVVTCRDNATRNPHAVFAKAPITREEYLASRMVVEPVRVLDCDMHVDGAVAVVLVSEERAADLHRDYAVVAGYGMYHGGSATTRVGASGSFGPTLADIQHAARSVMERMWRSAGLAPSDVDVAQIYDGFSFFVYWWLEGGGFAPIGRAQELIQDGRIALGGELPLNTFGGGLGQGRLHGIGHIAEAALQVSGRAHGRQVAGCEVAIVTSGPPGNGATALAFTRGSVR